MSFGAKNRLVECSECHLLYHQECHKPPITENEINDPRLVWYCSECTKKNQEKVQPKVKTVHQEPSSKKSKNDTPAEPKAPLFKRNEKSSSSSSSSHNKGSSGSGMAHLAASIQGMCNFLNINCYLCAICKILWYLQDQSHHQVAVHQHRQNIDLVHLQILNLRRH